MGCYKPTTLKRNLVPRFGEARKKDGFGISGFRQLGGLPPLKETFVGSLELVFGLGVHIDPYIIGFISNSWVSLQVTSDTEGYFLGPPKVQDERISQSRIPSLYCLGMLPSHS